jgi:endonuclease/exonuclease/phosphatase family metal-dependent hydrolase
MIRIVTLNDDKNRLGSTARVRKLTDQLRLAEIDILCCQGVKQTRDGKQDPAREIAESLHMTYSFSATKFNVNTNENRKEMTIEGLSILAGEYVWMLNSGSFCLPGECPDKKQVAQFAVIRQNGNSVLVVNTEFSLISSVQLKQLRAVFSHNRLQERFDAVVICSNRNIAVSKNELKSATTLSAYKLTCETLEIAQGKDKLSNIGLSYYTNGHSNCGMIFTLIPKNQAPATVKIYGASANSLLDLALNTEIEFKQALAMKKNLFMFPLSYTEQWSGSENRKQNLAMSTP